MAKQGLSEGLVRQTIAQLQSERGNIDGAKDLLMKLAENASVYWCGPDYDFWMRRVHVTYHEMVRHSTLVFEDENELRTQVEQQVMTSGGLHGGITPGPIPRPPGSRV